MISVELKKFEPGDLERVFEIQLSAYKPLYEKYRDDDMSPYMESAETLLRKYTRPGTVGYIFLEDGEAVGAVRIILDAERKSGRVSALGVLPRCQGRGIAQKALLEIETVHSEVENWYLDTILQEEGNCRLYEKLGYRKTGKYEEIKENMTIVFYEKKK